MVLGILAVQKFKLISQRSVRPDPETIVDIRVLLRPSVSKVGRALNLDLLSLVEHEDGKVPALLNLVVALLEDRGLAVVG
jgi:hypothetical protein